jgi:hypothetical protein
MMDTVPAMHSDDWMEPASPCVTSAGKSDFSGRIGNSEREGSGFQTNPSAGRWGSRL